LKLREFPLLADESLDADVVAFLRQSGFDVVDVLAAGLRGLHDVDLLNWPSARAAWL
jgi:Domain of unknown function (DUF5615)